MSYLYALRQESAVGPSSLAERDGEKLKRFKCFCLKNDTSQGPNLVLTILFVPNSLDIGPLEAS